MSLRGRLAGNAFMRSAERMNPFPTNVFRLPCHPERPKRVQGSSQYDSAKIPPLAALGRDDRGGIGRWQNAQEKMQEIMQNAENVKGWHFCHFCYCITFPEYAIIPLVKSKNNAPVLPGAEITGKTVQKIIICLYFSYVKATFDMGKIQEGQTKCPAAESPPQSTKKGKFL